MIKLNWIGFIIPLLVYIPYVFYAIFGRKKSNKCNHKQMKVIETICLYGMLFFGFITIEGVGYQFINIGLEITWIILFFICLIFYYICWLRYFFMGRKEEYLYDKVLFIYPIGIMQSAIFLVSAIFLFHPIVFVFSIGYCISHIYLGVNRR